MKGNSGPTGWEGGRECLGLGQQFQEEAVIVESRHPRGLRVDRWAGRLAWQGAGEGRCQEVRDVGDGTR